MPNQLPLNSSTLYTPLLFETYLTTSLLNNLSTSLSDNAYLVYWICGVYVVTIHLIKHLMRDRAPLKLRPVLLVWNVSLAVFSIWGTSRVSHHLVHGITSRGISGYISCHYVEDDILVGLWKRLFGMSKILELGDTLFIVFRKSPLSFLHWYHHVTVLLFSVPLADYSARLPQGHTNVGNFYSGMNFAVHSVMYSYYAARAAGYRVWRPLTMSITILQILQMVGGLWAGFYVPWWRCGRELTSFPMMCTIGMYGSYFLLFCHFFVRAYLVKRTKKE